MARELIARRLHTAHCRVRLSRNINLPRNLVCVRGLCRCVSDTLEVAASWDSTKVPTAASRESCPSSVQENFFFESCFSLWILKDILGEFVIFRNQKKMSRKNVEDTEISL